MRKWWMALCVMAVMLSFCFVVEAESEDRYACDNCNLFTATVTDSGAYHLMECSYCGHRKEQSHAVMCSDLNTCYVCGNIDNLFDVETKHNEVLEYYDDEWDHHACDCGYYDEYVPHFSSFQIEAYDENRHWLKCGCYQYSETSVHWAFCFSMDSCWECGVEDVVIGEVRHRFGYAYDLNDAEHQYFCAQCFVLGDIEAHNFVDGVCTICDYEKIAARLPGDASGDNTVSLADVIAILSGVVSSQTNADVNDDGEVDELDALLIMQYDAGWDVIFK